MAFWLTLWWLLGVWVFGWRGGGFWLGCWWLLAVCWLLAILVLLALRLLRRLLPFWLLSHGRVNQHC